MVVTRDVKDLAGLQLVVERHSLNRLRRIEVVAGLRQRVHVVLCRILVNHLQCLSDSRAEHTRRVLAVLLIELHGRRGNRRRGERSIDIHQDIRHRAVRADDEGLRGWPFPDVQLVAARVGAHADQRIDRRLPHVMHVADDGAGAALAGYLRRCGAERDEQRSASRQ